MVLGDVEETVTTVEIDDETMEEIVKVCHVQFMMQVFFRIFIVVLERCLSVFLYPGGCTL